MISDNLESWDQERQKLKREKSSVICCPIKMEKELREKSKATKRYATDKLIEK